MVEILEETIVLKATHIRVVQLPQHALHSMQLRLRKLRANVPVSVHILAHQVAAIVAQEHSIWVHHRHYFEDKVVSQHSGYGVVAHQELNEALAHVGGRSFAGMCPAQDDNHSDEAAIQAIGGALLLGHMVDGQQVHIAILLRIIII